MAIQYNFLAPIDQKVRDRGYDFVSQNKYLQDGFKSTDGISYEGDGSPVSYANSMGGIMSQAPIPGPLKYIPEGGGGDGPTTGPATDNSGFDYESEAYGITDSELTDDINAINNPTLNKASLAKIGFSSFLGPFSMMGTAYRERKKAEAEAIENARQNEVSRRAAENKAAGDRGGYQAGYGGDFMDGPQGAGRGNKSSDKGGSDTMGSSADGGIIGHGGNGGLPGKRVGDYNTTIRTGYFFGGRVNYKTGGRINFKGGGMDASSDDFGGGNTPGPGDTGGEGGNNPQDQSDTQFGGGGDNNNNPPVSNDNRVVTTDFISNNPSFTIDYTDPRNYASVYGNIGFDNLIDNDDLTAEGNVTGQFGPIGYDTNFTDQGITGTNLTAGNFNANISPDMQVQNISYSKGPFSISSDGQNTRAGLTFSYKNGGLAGLL